MTAALVEPQRTQLRNALGHAIGHEEAGILIDLFPSEPPPPTVTVEVLDRRLAAVERHVDDRFTALEQHLDHRFASVDATAARLDAKIDTTAAQLDAKIDATAAQLDAKIDAVPGRVTRELLRWLVPLLGLWSALLGALVAFAR